MNSDMLKLYAKKGFNVLFSAPHGVGKTQITKSIFDEVFGPMGQKWLYFSASTLDPWVDLVGVPHKGETPDGKPLLVLLRPAWVYEDIEAIFFDEINRAPDKVRNALMELIQFGSINGYKLKNLKTIWAAENPWDENSTYSVEKLDPAQKDRFQIQITLPSKPSSRYFREKYSEVGAAAVKWWESLNEENKKEVSPRRLEDSIVVYLAGGNLTDMFVSRLNPSALTSALREAQIKFDVEAFFVKTDDKLKLDLTLDNLLKFESHILKDEKLFNRVQNLVSKEILQSPAFKKSAFCKKIEKNNAIKEALSILSTTNAATNKGDLLPKTISVWTDLDSLQQNSLLETFISQEVNLEEALENVKSAKVKKEIQEKYQAKKADRDLKEFVYLNSEYSDNKNNSNPSFSLLRELNSFHYGTTYPSPVKLEILFKVAAEVDKVYTGVSTWNQKDFLSMAYLCLDKVLAQVPQSHIRHFQTRVFDKQELALIFLGALHGAGMKIAPQLIANLEANGRIFRSFYTYKTTKPQNYLDPYLENIIFLEKGPMMLKKLNKNSVNSKNMFKD